MKVILAFALMVLTALNGINAQQGLLWKVQKPGAKKVSYLFGTMHTSDSLCNTWSDAWWDAFGSCQVLAGEADFSDFDQAFKALALTIMKDTTLSDLYSPRDFAFVDSVMLSDAAPEMRFMHRKLRPLISMVSLMEQPSTTGPYRELMDVRLQNMARSEGKQVMGLETGEEQITTISVLSLREEAELLLAFLKENDGVEEYLEEMVSTYVTQDLERMANDESMKDLPPRLWHALLEVRNERFLSRVAPEMKKKNVFCAVGAMHLPGPTGMIEGLRTLGYEVSPVDFSFTQPLRSSK